MSTNQQQQLNESLPEELSVDEAAELERQILREQRDALSMIRADGEGMAPSQSAKAPNPGARYDLLRAYRKAVEERAVSAMEKRLRRARWVTAIMALIALAGIATVVFATELSLIYSILLLAAFILPSLALLSSIVYEADVLEDARAHAEYGVKGKSPDGV